MIAPARLLALLAFAAALPSFGAEPDKAAADIAAKVNATGASLAPISADSANWRFTALNVAKDFTDAGLAPLAPLAAKITSLDLARTKVTDAGLKSVAAMTNLTELHLEGTAVTDAGLDALKPLVNLEYINLYGTKVTDASMAKLGALPKLKAIYLWQTAVTKNGVAALKKALPAAHINIGWTAEDDAKPVAVAAAAPAAKPAATPAAKPAAPAATPAAAPAAAAKPVAADAGKAVVFASVILPILEAKCTSCHGAEKGKGKLRMHTFADLMKGGGDGKSIEAGKPADSLAIKRIELAKDDDEHMPPTDEPQMSKEEVALLKWWIAEGANETVTVAAIKKTPDIEAILGGFIKADAKPAAAKASEKPKAKPLSDAEKKAVADVAAKLQALGASLMPLALDTEQQRLSVINAAEKFGDKELAMLAPIASTIAWVDLGRSKVTDAGLGTLGKFANLERLHLENTAVTDAGLAQLAGLKNLEYLNIYGTKVTDAGIAKLEGVKSLKKLFVWQTQVTGAGAKALEAKIPGLKVNVGLTEAEIAKIAAIPPPAAPAPAKKEEAKKDAKADAKAAKPAAKADPKADAKADGKPEVKPAVPVKKDEAKK